MIVIIDYGMGNLRSVQKAIESVGHKALITSDPDQVRTADKVILPGVGAFADAIHELRKNGMDQAFIEAVKAGKPCLGVCLGLQLLFDHSVEGGVHQGLGLIPGKITRFDSEEGLKIPHMGWNTLEILQPSSLLDGVANGTSVYFVHSYHAVATDHRDVIAEADYPGPFAAIVGRDNLVACQFHPEKSQQAGLRIYANFASQDRRTI